MSSLTTVSPTPHVDTRDTSIGAAMLAAKEADFVHDVDVVVPAARDSQAHVAFAFDKKRLASCCGTIRNMDATFGTLTTLPLDLPEAHAQSVGPLLRSLVPPCKIPVLSPPLMSDMVQAANWLALEPARFAGLRAAYEKSLKHLTPADMAMTLNRSDNTTLGLAADAAARLLTNDLAARSHVTSFDAGSLAAVLQSPCLNVHEDSALGLVKAWCEAHSQPGDSMARVMRANGLQACLRWHAMSEQLFDDCAEAGCLSPDEFDEVVAVRANPGPSETVCLTTLGSQFSPRDALEPVPVASWQLPQGWHIPAPWRFLTTSLSVSQSLLLVGTCQKGFTVKLGPAGITLTADHFWPYRWRDAAGTWLEEVTVSMEMDVDGRVYTVPCTVSIRDKVESTVAWPCSLAATHSLVIRARAQTDSGNTTSADRTIWQRLTRRKKAS